MANSVPKPRRRLAESKISRSEASLKRKALSLAIFLIFVASLLNALFGDRGLIELLRTRRTIAAIDRDITELRAQNAGLLDDIRALKTSPLAIERLARENLGLVKPGEIVLVIREPRKAERIETIVQPAPSAPARTEP